MKQSWQFGTRADGEVITAYQLKSEAGLRAIVLNHGATLQSLYLPNGQNIVLGFEDWEAYETDQNYIGKIIGPNANRIAEAQFCIEGDVFPVKPNDGRNNLHSGPSGFDTQIWDIEHCGNSLDLKLVSPDMRDGFPGPISANLKISLFGRTLRLDIQAKAERPTPINMTWHPYWNLSPSQRIDGHNLAVNAHDRTELNSVETISIKDTRFDFTKPQALGSVRLDTNYSDVKQAQLSWGDINMTVTSSLPDMQVYTGDNLIYPRAAIALEPQFRPNDINLSQDCLLRPGEIYHHWIEYKFDIN